jgi:hypothetical protein
MKSGLQKRIGFVLPEILLMFATCAFAQVQVGDNTTLKLTGSAGLGWTGTWDGNDMNSLTYGFNGNLTGDYYDPRFLNWTINPYLNQSRLNSNFHSTTSASGVNAMANFLSSSRTPMQFTYERDHNSEGTFNVPGSTGSYKTVGNGQAIGFNAAYLPEDLPSIQGSFSHSSSAYEIIGTPGAGTAHATSFGLSSGYDLWDTRLSGSYTKSFSKNESPALDQPNDLLSTNSKQDSLQFGASRRLTSWSNGSFNFGRSHLNAEYTGARTEATFDTITGLVSAQATKKLSFNFHANYSSNLSAQFLSDILAAGSSATPSGVEAKGPSFTSNYLNYGVTSGYSITRELTATGGINRQVQGRPGFPDTTSTIMNAGLTWSHQVLGGTFGAHYGIAYYFSPMSVRANNQTTVRESTFTGHNAAISYGRNILGFATNGSFSYGRSMTYLLVGYVQTNYSVNGGLSREIAKWNFGVNSSYSKAHIDNITISDSSTASYSATMAHKSLGLSANYSRSNGSGLQVGNNIIPSQLPGPYPLILFRGESYGGGISYRPIRRWTISGNFSKLRYNTTNLEQNSNNTSEQIFLRSDYHFRQLDFNSGYSHLTQGLGVGLIRPATIDTVFLGVSRRFDAF